MEAYKVKFIEHLISTGALTAHTDRTLKSNRSSPWFVNMGAFDDGQSIETLGDAFAESLLKANMDFDVLYGIPEKGKSIAVATVIALARKGKNFPFFSTRKDAKTYGEMTNLPPEEMAKQWIIGYAPKKGQKIAQLDDVFTAGDAKYEAMGVLQKLGDFQYPVLAIAVDRQEVAFSGATAIEKYEKDTGVKVVSIIHAGDVYEYLKENLPVKTPSGNITAEHLQKLRNYLETYGTTDVKQHIKELEGEKKVEPIIEHNKSVIPACDISTLDKFEEIVRATYNITGIGGYKVGFDLALRFGLGNVVETAKKHTNKPIIYDHQKAGTDIPDTGKNYANVCKACGVDAAILFPQSGPETLRAWVYELKNAEVKVIVGGIMTHNAYLKSDGGFIDDEGAYGIYRIAAEAGVTDFVVPGNKPEIIQKVRAIVVEHGAKDPILYSPGFIAQGGKITEAGKVAGEKFHAIVGRGIYGASDIAGAAYEYASQIQR